MLRYFMICVVQHVYSSCLVTKSFIEAVNWYDTSPLELPSIMTLLSVISSPAVSIYDKAQNFSYI